MESAEGGLGEAITSRASQVGRLTELIKLRDAQDLGAAETNLREATERHVALPVPERTVTQGELDAARSTEAALTLELEHVNREIQRAHGALEQVGGAVARERLRDATEAFELAERQEKKARRNTRRGGCCSIR